MASNVRDSRGRPPLPPRQRQSQQSSSIAGPSTMPADPPPPYELIAHQQKAFEKAHSKAATDESAGLMHRDPRSSSQDSLLPQYEEHDSRRTLLLVYIHGFMGNETSFRSFPAHVHNLLVVLLAETHVVHTKIYPRYKSRGHISIARDDFGKWLGPHESDKVDVVLLGHSMGGLLAAEVALMPPPRPASRPLAHRIVGTINFDVPFLGMHPGVVKSGLSSIFKPSEETHKDEWVDHTGETGNDVQDASSAGTGPVSPPSRTDTLWASGTPDPNFNPAYANDVNLPVRKGWSNAWHFINKHSGELVKSTKKLVSSHLEFGGAMANYGELKARYARIRALEEADERIRKSVVEGGVPPRVRFINYYTASTGRPRKPASPSRRPSSSPQGSRATSAASSSRTPAPPAMPGADQNQSWGDAMESLKIEETRPARNKSNQSEAAGIPAAPPPLGDLSYIQDANIRKVVETEHRKAVEAYEKAIADHQRNPQPEAEDVPKPTVKPDTDSKTPQPAPPKPESEMTHSEREKFRLEKEKQRMEAEGRRMRGEKEPERPAASSLPSTASVPSISTSLVAESTSDTLNTADSSATQDTKAGDDGKSKKDRKFCVLPPKDSSGERDPCWVRVFMKNVDEVGAHCGLFFVDERYERLVGDIAERIENWVREDDGLRVASAMSSPKS